MSKLKITTGFIKLDQILRDGFFKEELTVIAAVNSTGKSHIRNLINKGAKRDELVL